MSGAARGKTELKSHAPFGAVPRRSNAPLIFWCVLFGVWALFLVWMAAYHTHPR
jgi:hypothetical protein